MKQRPKKTEDVLEDLILVCLARSLEVLGRQIDLPDVITAGGRPYKTAHIVEGLRHRGSFWTDGTMDFALLPKYFGGSFDREYAEKLVVKAFEEDAGGFESGISGIWSC
ncbi:hypothetical protein THAOC_04998 [Thalassiosira oceanica]|uniref:Uncharacterized protein n=1 Tax=Thalassiosira oceanica TaxID=159749 RepID=K0THZ9_THAOC|nr:hypothetical protein THAOC_04998 [Thalassiosira oceanica]|eukprot:EJK73381.1 hypothetical protein THAOC_04998 [Thalassiosira oceanica]